MLSIQQALDNVSVTTTHANATASPVPFSRVRHSRDDNHTRFWLHSTPGPSALRQTPNPRPGSRPGHLPCSPRTCHALPGVFTHPLSAGTEMLSPSDKRNLKRAATQNVQRQEAVTLREA